MKKCLIAGLLVAVSAAAFADGEKAVSGKPRFSRTAGGLLVKPGTYTGKVAIIDTQSQVSFSVATQLVADLERLTECRFAAEKAARDVPQKLMADHKADLALVVIDDPKEPTMLLAPEDHWGVVNVARLTDDLPGQGAKAKFLPSRARKEYLRAISILMGGGSSQFPGNAMNAATVRELDQMADQIPVDMLDYYGRYLAKIGVKSKVLVPYRTACREGWAPQPTNDVQKSIWERVHAIPKAPMKIEFDPKKGR